MIREALSLAGRRSVLAAMIALLGGLLAVAMAIPEDAETVSFAADWFVYELGYSLVYLVVVMLLVRSLARSSGLPGRPRWWTWIAALVVYGALIYGGAFALEVLAYLVLRDLMTWVPVEWHFGVMQIVVAVALFPLTVWQCALLSGERSIGLSRAWKGIWSRRQYVLVLAAIVYGSFALSSFGLEWMIDQAVSGLPEPFAFALLLLPIAVGNVLAVVLSFGVLLRIHGEDIESAIFE